MASDLSQHILQREIQRSRLSRHSHRQLYGSKRFVDDLDIVNELAGHSGCVNALSWSRSGRLLASGSDDRHLNIHSYQPDESTKQFQLQTTVATGHTQNIFSVKFMPHSNDSTIVTCAGDNQVRVFDLNYTGTATTASQASSLAATSRQRGRDQIYQGVRYLSDGDTNARIYRSHADRAKRVVTEDSPYLFMTCSEDGEVRQWDTRQPSSYYPRAGGDVYIPPPLISYRRFNVDLNTISCSGSQPHYIALGGSHLHCFLHDRRMSGRNQAEETGRPSSAPRSGADEEFMTEATRCVRRFAPRGQRKVKRNERGHITACKISDARPHELVVSWSHDKIYKFDMLAEARVGEESKDVSHKRQRAVKHGSEPPKTSILNATLQSPSPPSSKLRIHFGNGQQEDIPIKDDETEPPSRLNAAAERITKTVLSICETMFRYSERDRDRTQRFTKVLGQAAAILSDIDELISDWTYPLDPSPDQVNAQKALRNTRERTRRFIQVAGVLARVLGGRLQTVRGDSALLNQFMMVVVRYRDQEISSKEQFCYDTIKAIVLWLESGPSMLVENFTRLGSADSESSLTPRFPIPSGEDSIESINQYLGPYLTRLATSGQPILDFDRNPYQFPEDRQAYHTPDEAIEELLANIDTPFTDSLPQEYAKTGMTSIDRGAMIDHWAYIVGRGLLYNAIFPLDFAEIDLAFGGTGCLSLSMQRAALKLTSMDLEDGEDESEEHEEAASSSPVNQSDDDMVDETSVGGDDYQSQHEDSESEDSDDDDAPMDWGYNGARQRARDRARRRLGSGVPCSGPTQSYSGHCNVRTVKDVNYYGLEDEYVVSGSDDGNFFIWDTKSGKLLNILEGDGEVVNVIQGHPYEPMLAVSGIDSTIKIFSPDNRARTVARYGEEVSSADASAFSSIAWPHRPGRRTRTSNAAAQRESVRSEPPQDQDEDDDYVAPKGLSSRKRMGMQSAITTMNAENMRQGDSDNMITSSYLRLVARHLRAQRAAAQGGALPANLNLPGVNAEEDEDGRVRIVLGDDCVLM